MSRRMKKRPTLFTAEKRTKRIIPKNNKAFSLAWDETEALGITPDMRRSGPGMLSDQERKETLYQAYLNSVWISACCDVIAKRITSGGMLIELTDKGTENQAEFDKLHEFLHYINEDEDFLHLVRAIATDILIFGEAYLEIVYKDGLPFSLHKIDCITMNYKLDQHGNTIGFEQHMTHSTEVIEFDAQEVVRWWFADPKASKKSLSPIERVLGSIDSEVHMADWVRSFFRKGARPPFWIKFPGAQDEAQRFVTWLRENYTGTANAHVPLVLYEDAELHEIGKGAIDMDFVKGRELSCKEILAAYQVPPALIGLIEAGNIGGGTGSAQEKSFQYNACDPLRHLIFEKFNDRVTRKFGPNYHVNTRYGDYRADEEITKNQDMRIRNGTVSVNEARKELGLNPVDGGDHNVMVTVREIVDISSLADIKNEHDEKHQLDMELQKEQIHKMRHEVHPDEDAKQDMLDNGEIAGENPDKYRADTNESIYRAICTFLNEVDIQNMHYSPALDSLQTSLEYAISKLYDGQNSASYASLIIAKILEDIHTASITESYAVDPLQFKIHFYIWGERYAKKVSHDIVALFKRYAHDEEKVLHHA